VARGYRVGLVEKNDFASGTSSKSTKLVHGGIRYLPNFDFALVHEGLVERGILLQNAPFLVHPLAFVLPIYQGDRHPVGMPFTTPGGIGLGMILDVGLWMYDLMAGKRGIKHHRRLSREAVQSYAPALVSERLKEGVLELVQIPCTRHIPPLLPDAINRKLFNTKRNVILIERLFHLSLIFPGERSGRVRWR
jgi:glycerol-3-phosphate dehydrogenase